MLWAALGFAAGVLCYRYVGSLCPGIQIALTLGCVVLWVIHCHVAALACVAAFCGIADMQCSATGYITLPQQSLVYAGEVEDSELHGSSYPHCMVRITHCGTSPDSLQALDKSLLTVCYISLQAQADTVFAPGRYVVFKAAFRRTDRPRYHPEENRPVAGADARGIWHSAFVTPDGIIYSRPGTSFSACLNRQRQRILGIVQNIPVGGDVRAFLATALFGHGEWLSQDVREALSSVGLAHIVALSGLHVGIVLMLMWCVLFPLNHIRLWPLRSLVAVTVLWCYCLVSGAGPSMTRAVVMATVAMVTLLCSRVYSPLNALGIAAIVVMIPMPSVIFAPGFQLSFAAVAGIILLARPLNPFAETRNSFLRGVGYLVSTTLAATLSTWLVVAYHFHNFPLLFLPANLLTLPVLLPVLLGSGLLVVLLTAAGMPCAWPAAIAGMSYNLIAGLLRILQDVGLTVSLPDVTVWCVAAGALSVGLFVACVRNSRFRFRFGLACVAASVLCIVSLVQGEPGMRQGREWFVSRGVAGTEILVRDNDVLYVISPYHLDSIRRADTGAMVGRRFENYLRRRAVGNVTVLTADDSTAIWHDGWIETGLERVRVIGSNPCGRVEQADVALLCKGFAGSVDDVVAHCAPRRLIIGEDVHHSRKTRWCREAAEASVPAVIVGK